MKKRVIVELPLKLANWLLTECDFHQAMLNSNLRDVEYSECPPCIKNQIANDIVNYKYLQSKVSVAVSRFLSKMEE